MEMEIRNTKIMGLFLVGASLASLLLAAPAFAQGQLHNDDIMTTHIIDAVHVAITHTSYDGTQTFFDFWVSDAPVTDNVLILYNTTSRDSITVKDYYLAHRPQMSNANVLGLNCTSAESISRADYHTHIEVPVLAWFRNNPFKVIRYILLLYDIPSRISPDDKDYGSVQCRLSGLLSDNGVRTGNRYEAARNRFSIGEYPGMTALVTAINFGSVADCEAYIDKVAAMYKGMAHPSIEVSGLDASYNTAPRYGFDDTARSYERKICGECRDALKAVDPSVLTTYSGNAGDTPAPDQTTHISTLADVGGFSRWSSPGGNYPIDGSVKFTGSSKWYILRTIESFNGQRDGGRAVGYPQGYFLQWFSSSAFGSTANGGAAYSCTPVGAVSHVWEPYLAGINSPGYFTCWYNGYDLSEAAWQSKRTEFMQVCGDPLVRR